MKKMTKKCPVCGTTYNYIDLRNIPSTCGSRLCVSNFKYRERTRNLRTGEYQSYEKIGKI